MVLTISEFSCNLRLRHHVDYLVVASITKLFLLCFLVSTVLEVGQCEMVCHTGTSLDGYKSYRHFRPEKYHTGTPLHSDHLCADICSHIAKEKRLKLVADIIKNESKIAVLVDESTLLSCKTILTVCMWAAVAESGPPTFSSI